MARLPSAARAVPLDEMPEPIGGCQAEGAEPLRPRLARIGKPARGQSVRRDDPDQPITLAQRQQSRCRGLDQPLVVERAIGARNAVKPFVGCAERLRQRRQIGFLGHGVGADQHALRAGADRARTALRGGDDAVRQQMTDAIQFRAGARLRRCPMVERRVGAQHRVRRAALEPNLPLGAANGRPDNATQRHRWPPNATPRPPPRLFPTLPVSGPRLARPIRDRSRPHRRIVSDAIWNCNIFPRYIGWP